MAAGRNCITEEDEGPPLPVEPLTSLNDAVSGPAPPLGPHLPNNSANGSPRPESQLVNRDQPELQRPFRQPRAFLVLR